MALLKIAVPVLAIFFKEKNAVWGYRERQNLPRKLKDHNARAVVWLHAASLSEAETLCKFVDFISSHHPADLYLVTAASKAGVEFLENNLRASICAVGYLPYDTVPYMRKVINNFNVQRIWLIETELWPSMLLAASKQNVPVGIVNGRLEEKTYKRFAALKFVFKPLFEKMDIVLVQDKIYASRYSFMGVAANHIHVVGNLNSFVNVKRPERRTWSSLRKKLSVEESVLLLTAGSIYPGEGVILRQCTEELRALGLQFKLIVVPRHPETAGQLIAELGGDDVVHLKESKTSQTWTTCLIETKSALQDLYSVADVGFVGGTLVDVGGHDVWDAARFGIPVFFGPNYYDKRESFERLISSGVGFKAQTAHELATMINRVMRTDAARFIRAQVLFAETVNKTQAILEPLIP
ncbi:3-deoxy-D-manno-octulosonic-acid transferase [Chitinispirillum alkaliphilum]|nr:3-deoxy-D-manno-octulosonic-acid transferase [Chitinispirillum alkaliphilum]